MLCCTDLAGSASSGCADCAARFLTRRSRSVCSEHPVSERCPPSAAVQWAGSELLCSGWQFLSTATQEDCRSSATPQNCRSSATPKLAAATMCECAHSFAQRFLISKRLRCTRHEDEMLWHKVERAVQCAVLRSMVRIKLTCSTSKNKHVVIPKSGLRSSRRTSYQNQFSAQFNFHSLVL